MDKNPEEFMYECPNCSECFIMSYAEVFDGNMYTCQHCGEEIRFSVSGVGEVAGNNLNQLTMECPQCGGSFTLNLNPQSDGNYSVCDECGAEIEFTDEILQQLRDDIHGIEKRNVIDEVD